MYEPREVRKHFGAETLQSDVTEIKPTESEDKRDFVRQRYATILGKAYDNSKTE